MLLLGVDTSGPEGSLALCLGDAGHFDVLEVISLAGRTYSAQLIPQLSALFTRSERTRAELGGFAVASGPGSFTGLRVGLASVKALADVLQKPIAAVSVLEAVAAASTRSGKVVAAIDAARKQVYVGLYETEDGHARRISESLLTNEEFAASVPSYGAVQVVTPDPTVAGLVSGARLQLIERPRADAFARLGLTKVLAGETVSPEDLEANYIRRSDAEIFAKPS